MDEADIRRSAQFLIERRGAEAAKQWAAQRALDAEDGDGRAAWLRILQAIIDLSPATGVDPPLN
jgi:hypothetical protein